MSKIVIDYKPTKNNRTCQLRIANSYRLFEPYPPPRRQNLIIMPYYPQLEINRCSKKFQLSAEHVVLYYLTNHVIIKLGRYDNWIFTLAALWLQI